jgi:acetyl esterase/lipase
MSLDKQNVLIGAVFCGLMLLASPADAQPRPARQAADKAKAVPSNTPESVRVDRDIVYAKYGDREVKLDLYLPKVPPEKPLPCIVVIHGGGWRSGDKQRFARQAIYLAEHGYAAACIGYRLLPEVSFPAPIEDCKAAVRWVRANAKKYDIDPERIGATGGSAGGHLTAMLASSHKVAELEGNGGNAGIASRVQAAVGMATPADMSRFAQMNRLEKDVASLVSPLTHVDADSAPILLIHSDADGTVPHEQSVRLQAKYKAAGVRAELVTINGAPHAFWNQDKWFTDSMSRTVKFFDETLQKAEAASKE